MPVPPPTAIFVECEHFTVTPRDGKLVLEIHGATELADLPPKRVYLNGVDAAKRLGIPARTFYRQMANKKNPIPHTRFCGRPRFVESEITAWADRGESAPARRVAAAISTVGGGGRRV